jgi:hypothetical protein
LDVPVGRQANGKSEERLADVVAAFPADAQAAEPWSPEIVRSTT